MKEEYKTKRSQALKEFIDFELYLSKKYQIPPYRLIRDFIDSAGLKIEAL